MKEFNFGNNFISWIMILYNELQLRTINNGFASQCFSPTRGILQGNPVSSYLFLLVIEILAIKLRANPKIQGIMVNKMKNLLSQFADDLNFFMKFSQSSWEATVQELSDYERVSGMKVNYNKLVVYRIGSLKNSNARFYSNRKLIWSDKPLYSLGVYFSNDYYEQLKLNIEPVIQKIETTLKIWQSRDLTLLGKILIVNSLVTSLLIYRMSVMPVITKTYIKKIDKLIHNFIWNGKRAKKKSTILAASKVDGGAGLFHLENKDKAAKLQWIVKIQSNEALQSLADEILENPVGNLLWNCQLNKKDANKVFQKNTFWHQTAKLWMELSYEHPVNEAMVLRQVLWFNTNIKINEKVIMYSNWHKHGINLISNLFTQEGNLKSVHQLKNEFNCQIAFTELYRIQQAIPVTWKRWLKEKRENVANPTKLEIYLGKPKIFNVIYRQINENSNILQELKYRWASDFTDITIDYLKKSLNNISKCTIEVKLRNFQYRLINKAIVTNIQLKHYKIKDNYRCTFCGRSKETIKHLFMECKRVKSLYLFIETVSKQKLDLSPKNILFNQVVPDAKAAKNTLILITKQYIYREKCMNNKIRTLALGNYLQMYQELEGEIAKQKNKQDQHKRKWKNITFM